jgi:hypothetical protein
LNKRFDLRKLTLTDFKPSEFQKATGKLSLEQQKTKQPTPESKDPVPEGRTTLHLNKIRGVLTSQPVGTQPPQEEPSQTTVVQPASLPESTAVPVHEKSVIEQNQNSPLPQDNVNQYPIAEDKLYLSDSLPSGSYVDLSSQEKTLAPESTQSILNNTQSPQVRDERSAALHVKAVRPQQKKQTDAGPDDSVAFNTRQPKWLKDKFFMACSEKGTTPSIVIRNLMKSYCGLCLVMFVVFQSFAFDSKDTTFSTEKILSYFYSKTFLGIKGLMPDLKASIGARHSLWQTGAQDSTDYIYADRSNTRLEAKIDIPILDVSYLKNRSKDKDELRAFVMKSLSKILAAQKSVNILETRSSGLRTRLEYLRNQVTLKLLNKSDIFPIEDEFYAILTQLYESQSTLEQRIIDLAVIAGNDWLEAYKMIVKWDGKLFD